MQMDDGHLEHIGVENIDEMEDMITKNRDLVFSVGEKVKIKGGDFRIKSIGRKMMILEGLPGTRIAT